MLAGVHVAVDSAIVIDAYQPGPSLQRRRDLGAHFFDGWRFQLERDRCRQDDGRVDRRDVIRVIARGNADGHRLSCCCGAAYCGMTGDHASIARTRESVVYTACGRSDGIAMTSPCPTQ